MARKTGKSLGISTGLNNPAVNAGLEGDPEIDVDAQVGQDFTRMAIAARTRQRLTKYGVLQLRMLDLYVLKRVKIPPMHIKLNKKLQKGHPQQYETILRAEGQDQQADEFIQMIQ